MVMRRGEKDPGCLGGEGSDEAGTARALLALRRVRAVSSGA